MDDKKCKHRKKTATTAPYEVCVGGRRCNPGAHGGRSDRETCRCGAVRTVNRNGFYAEFGKWEDTE